jgi:hypothetical protein
MVDFFKKKLLEFYKNSIEVVNISYLDLQYASQLLEEFVLG